MPRARPRLTALRVAMAIAWIVAVASPPCAIAKPGPLDLVYRVVRVAGDRYEISLRFRGERSGRSTLRIPGEWASAQHAERGIEALTLVTPGATLEDTDDANVKRIVHRPGATLRVRYRLAQIMPGDPDTSWPTNYLPVIRPTYFAWIGHTTWVVPTEDERIVRVSVRFDGLPDNWNYASSLGLDRHGVSFVGTTENFRASLFVGGDFRLRSRRVQGGQLITALRGDWPFRDADLADRVAFIVDGERRFWNDTKQGDFLVTMMPVKSGGPNVRSYNGTGLQHSFATWVTGVSSLADLDFLFTHEYFHTWNASAIGRKPEPQVRWYWFSEGLTDYYSHLLRLRWHLLSLEGYVDEYDQVLSSLASLPESNLSNAEIGARFFSEPRTIGKLPYWRGMLLAASWDAQIRATSGGRRSLDDAMRAMRDQNRDRDLALSIDRIATVMLAAGVVDPRGDVERFIDRGATIKLADEVMTACVRIEPIEEARFDSGFDIEATMKMSVRFIVGVDPDGPGYAAGLRDGQRMRSIDMLHRPDTPATVGIQDGDEDRVRKINYLPAGKPIHRQRATLRPGLTDEARARCLAALGVVATK